MVIKFGHDHLVRLIVGWILGLFVVILGSGGL
jgi:hypothetical protein